MIKEKKIIKHIVSWLKKYIKKSKLNGFIVGISGGIDSSVTSYLTAMTQYPTIVLEIIIGKKKYKTLSQKHAEFLISKFSNVRFLQKDIDSLFDFFCENIISNISQNKKNKKNMLALANLKSRIYMLILYYYANINNFLVVGTGNKIEDFGIGFFTKYGDGAVDIHPIADLYKSEINILAKELNIIREIQEAKPTDGLWEDQRSDEDQLGANYKDLEWAMINENKQNNFVSKKEHRIIKLYKKLHKKNQHKMISIPVCKIPFCLKQEKIKIT
ncbi:NAD(+) synthase [Blattabacterium cuenoti]|uniref:NAD(+) synthase n=1 Tax=Blattabacterium cuenoti TaxID=1653831 RepID=UPI00163C253C|nr:NAD(+) synthase [Blattabacterium cuenoti]